MISGMGTITTIELSVSRSDKTNHKQYRKIGEVAMDLQKKTCNCVNSSTIKPKYKGSPNCAEAVVQSGRVSRMDDLSKQARGERSGENVLRMG